MKKWGVLNTEYCSENKVKKYRCFLWLLMIISISLAIFLYYKEFLKAVPDTVPMHHGLHFATLRQIGAPMAILKSCSDRFGRV